LVRYLSPDWYFEKHPYRFGNAAGPDCLEELLDFHFLEISSMRRVFDFFELLALAAHGNELGHFMLILLGKLLPVCFLTFLRSFAHHLGEVVLLLDPFHSSIALPRQLELVVSAML